MTAPIFTQNGPLATFERHSRWAKFQSDRSICVTASQRTYSSDIKVFIGDGSGTSMTLGLSPAEARALAHELTVAAETLTVKPEIDETEAA